MVIWCAEGAFLEKGCLVKNDVNYIKRLSFGVNRPCCLVEKNTAMFLIETCFRLCTRIT